MEIVSRRTKFSKVFFRESITPMVFKGYLRNKPNWKKITPHSFASEIGACLQNVPLYSCIPSILQETVIFWFDDISGSSTLPLTATSQLKSPGTYFYRPPSEGWGKVIVSVCSHFGGRGGTRSQIFWGSPRSQIFGDGSPVSDFRGDTQSQIFGGVPSLKFWGGPRSQISGGSPVSDFLGGSPVSDFGGGTQSQIFGEGSQSQILGGVPSLRFSGGLSPVSDFRGGIPGLRFSGGSQVSNFQGAGYPVSVKGKNFDTRFGLIHVQTGKKIFCRGTPPQ